MLTARRSQSVAGITRNLCRMNFVIDPNWDAFGNAALNYISLESSLG